ncbi:MULTISPECIES: histidinol-phosphate transaminase [unclassified Beijerinckia]|uniref:histidinol-phosphate transaminase n=1 Tax=unclassified Beijerinckia TaxID=2638183 RepID=UPI000894AF57|nr:MULTISPECIES: histidinol-phosphate transaminase [unclassified Beijerinckia]MDH7799074.1 histidinol-phosphate aminotransferase [Beijerinckia sp. GAS462]SED95955.1 histidinol-phosphate aminotransferase [Beijerinckia sp. 28-YEA-48]
MSRAVPWSEKSTVIRPEVAAAPPYNAGMTIDEATRRYGLTKIAKLASGENPFGASPRIAAALAKLDLSIYPDPAGLKLRQAIADTLDVAAGKVILGNGSEDLIEIVCRAVLRSGDDMVTLYPSFPLHEIYAGICGARTVRVPIRDDFSIDEQALLDAVARRPRMLMFANPMNPVGSFLDRAGFDRLCQALHPSTVLVIDEAYIEYADPDRFPDALAMLRDLDNPFIVLRTFSKAYGLAGLRLGYGITSDSEFTEVLDRVRTPFNVNSVAQTSGLVALEDRAHMERSIRHNAVERERVAAALQAAGGRVAPSQGNFLFFSFGSPSTDLAEDLLAHGVIVKPWLQPGYTDFCRMTIGSREANDQFLQAVHAILAA